MTLAIEEELARRVIRPAHLAQRIVFTDGMPGCGKTLLSSIVSALDRMELEKYNYALEYVCSLWALGRMSDDAAQTMARMLTDLDLYNLLIAREANFRPSDLSGVFKNPRPWRYLRRLMMPDGDAATGRIATERPILNLVTHSLLPMSQPVMAGLGERARFVEVVRHPLYMIKAWFLYIHRYGTDARDFTIWFDHEGQALPWFATGIEERFARANAMDRSIYAIENLGRLVGQAMAGFSEAERARVVWIPFERFALDPWPFMRQLEASLGTQVTAVTRREMARQRVPRQRIADGLNLDVYKANGWEPPKAGMSERDELARRRQFAAEQATAGAMEVLDRLSRDYEATHWSPDR